jgi:serine/threonine protein kinase/tetratricopeptide (TPR) repeat protein
VIFGSYELLDRIAEGGMAEVWRARARGAAGFEKTVVIKRVLPGLMANPDFAELLVREAKIASRLSHANIVQIFDLGEEGGAYFIAMEHVDGKDLGAVMAYESRHSGTEGKPHLTRPMKLWILAEAAKALDYAHRRKGDDGRPLAIVHRDISPQNILVGYEGEVKVADFGIARADQQDLGRGDDPKVLRGKHAYMSPEQARGEPLDRRSDLFALGIVLWELVTNARLFKGGTAQRTLELVRAAELPAFDFEAHGWPSDLRRVLERALAPRVEDRYASAGELYTDLSQMLFRLGENVGAPELAEVLERMFPRIDTHSPNKLRVDVLLRAHEDATSSISGKEPGGGGQAIDGAPEKTALALRVSRRVSVEVRRVALLAARPRDGIDAALFTRAIEAYGGQLVDEDPDLIVAVFGTGGGERAAEHAARAALELRRRAKIEARLSAEPAPPLALAVGDARVYDGENADPEDALAARVRDLVRRAAAGEIVFDATVGDELARTFRLGKSATSALPTVEAFRARSERDALRMRRRAPLVGRQREARALSGALVSVAESGQGAITVILGEPGAGKSRLVAELRAATGGQDVVFVSGRGQESEGERSLGALADLFMDLCGVEEEDTPAERFAKVERLRVLGLAKREVRLAGELLGLAYPVARHERAGRPRGIELALAARKALSSLARERVVVLTIEDVHWVDDATRQILSLLLRDLSGTRVLVVLTARPGTPVPRVDGEPQIIELQPLGVDAALRLFAAAAGARTVELRLAERVLEETSGNPAWIEELGVSLRESGAVVVREGEAQLADEAKFCVPEHVRTVAAARVAQLRPDEVELLRITASFEDSVDVTTLCGVHGVPVAVAEGSLRRLLTSRLLAPETGTTAQQKPRGLWGGGTDAPPLPMRVRLGSGLLRRAVLEGVPASEVRLLHARAVAVLERAGSESPIDALAYHAARAGDRRRAPDYLVEAGRAAEARGEPRGAAMRYAEAAQLLREDGEDPVGERAVQLAIRSAELSLEAGDAEHALATLAAAAGAPLAQTEGAVRVRLAVLRARGAALRGDAQLRVATLEAVMRDVAVLDDLALRGAAELELSEGLVALGRSQEALVRMRSSVETLALGGDAALHGRALCVLAGALARAGLAGEAQQAVGRALAVAARLGHGGLRFGSLAAMAEVAEAQGDFVSAAQSFHEAGEVAAAQGLAHDEVRMGVRSALAALAARDLDAAATRASEAATLSRKQRRETLTNLAGGIVLAVGIARAPDAQTLALLARSVEGVLSTGTDLDAAVALRLRAFGERAFGQERAARATLAKAVHHAERAGMAALARQIRAEESLDSPGVAP